MSLCQAQMPNSLQHVPHREFKQLRARMALQPGTPEQT